MFSYLFATCLFIPLCELMGVDDAGIEWLFGEDD